MFVCLTVYGTYMAIIRWHIVIHGGIDGYSRLSVYLRASTNNEVETVLNCFIEAVQQYQGSDAIVVVRM